MAADDLTTREKLELNLRNIETLADEIRQAVRSTTRTVDSRFHGIDNDLDYIIEQALHARKNAQLLRRES